jgi:dihydrofolate synthase/folylpolyglutamate synthase
MTYPAAIDFLYNLRLFGTKFGLENTFRLAALCGDPQEDLRFIHVAGTNGKGSTCAMLESIYRHSGLKVGLFTSPHLVSFTERVQINRVPVSEADVARLTKNLVAILGEANSHAPRDQWQFKPTFFEFVTVMALNYFAKHACDLIIWETGMGGRLDATNIVRPLASVITNIQYDHEQWLGSTLASIAAEKAGIIKNRVPVITGADNEEALDVIRKRAEELNAPLTMVKEDAALELPLIGAHQKKNAAIALATVKVLQKQLPIEESTITKGLRAVSWPGRFQEISTREGNLIILDGAHNPDGARVLREALESRFPGQRFSFVLGLYKDKSWQAMCEILLPLAHSLFISPIQSERGIEPDTVKDFCLWFRPDLQIQTSRDLGKALADSTKHPISVVAGSLHFVGEAIQLLGISSAPSSKESALNEWDAMAARR